MIVDLIWLAVIGWSIALTLAGFIIGYFIRHEKIIEETEKP